VIEAFTPPWLMWLGVSSFPREVTETALAHVIGDKAEQAYCRSDALDMESHVSDLVSMGTIAMDQFDKNKGLFIFAVSKLEDMLNEFMAHYYAEEFPT
jgi:hypothetical protein